MIRLTLTLIIPIGKLGYIKAAVCQKSKRNSTTIHIHSTQLYVTETERD